MPRTDCLTREAGQATVGDVTSPSTRALIGWRRSDTEAGAEHLVVQQYKTHTRPLMFTYAG